MMANQRQHPEIAALEVIFNILLDLPTDSRHRVLTYAKHLVETYPDEEHHKLYVVDPNEVAD